MALTDVFATLCAGMLMLTAAVHSILGERRLIGPLLELREGVLQSDLARFLLRAVWHFMSIGFLIIAAGLIAGHGTEERTRSTLLVATAVGIGGAGIYDAIGSKGRHVGWPMLIAIGVLAVMAVLARS